MRGVDRRFGGVHGSRDVDLDVAHGERRAILGPNGAGKTTLFNVIAGDLPASSGTVELFGRDVTQTRPEIERGSGSHVRINRRRLFLGVSVEDSIYLSIVGVGAGRSTAGDLAADGSRPTTSVRGRRP